MKATKVTDQDPAEVAKARAAAARSKGKLFLKVFPSLESLDLSRVPMPDAALEPIVASLRNLKALTVSEIDTSGLD